MLRLWLWLGLELGLGLVLELGANVRVKFGVSAVISNKICVRVRVLFIFYYHVYKNFHTVASVRLYTSLHQFHYAFKFS